MIRLLVKMFFLPVPLLDSLFSPLKDVLYQLSHPPFRFFFIRENNAVPFSFKCIYKLTNNIEKNPFVIVSFHI